MSALVRCVVRVISVRPRLVCSDIYIYIYRVVLTFTDRFTALRFTATGAPQPARNQYACCPITFGM
jgi:hypothetical protein